MKSMIWTVGLRVQGSGGVAKRWRRAAVGGLCLIAALSFAQGDTGFVGGMLPQIEQGPLLPADRISARRIVVQALDQAWRRGDRDEVAQLNAILAQEALQRSYWTLKAWEGVRDARTGLIPRDPMKMFWNAKDCGADCFPFLLLAAYELESTGAPQWVEAMREARRLGGVLPKTIGLDPMEVMEDSLRDQIFGAAEYAKDGLVSIQDRLGAGPWLPLIEEMMEAVIDQAPLETKRGRIPAGGAEANGDLLQVLPRLYWMTGKAKYLEMAERIADVYLFDIMPANNGFPAAGWDFSKNEPRLTTFRIRDHGNELIPGFTELYYLEKRKGLPKAAAYRVPIKEFLDRLLTVCRTEDGMWMDEFDTRTLKAKTKDVVDNWGYVLNAYRTFDLAEGTTNYSAECFRVMQAAVRRKSIQWEGVKHDGYADTLESMLYQLPYADDAACRAWVDDEMEVMFDRQKTWGFVGGTYLDGNFIRTALMYADYKTGGVKGVPWRKDLRIGAWVGEGGGAIRLYVSSLTAWKGVLRFDRPRHRDYWNLPQNYPRLNAWPEWYAVVPDAEYTLEYAGTGETRSVKGIELIKGYPVEVDGKTPLRIQVKRVEGK
jgi:hypothetical protein